MKKEFIIKVVLIALLAFVTIWFGFRPYMSREFYVRNDDWAGGKLTGDRSVYDVVVAGEEPEGIAAAVAAARTGARALLLSESDTLGGVIARSLYTDLEINVGIKGELLNRGIFYEIYKKLGRDFTVNGYVSEVTDMVKVEKRIDTIYRVGLVSPVVEGDAVTGIKITADGLPKTVKGRRFIDATRDGKLLAMCGVPYFTGSEDLNLKNSFIPVRLNFEVSGVDWNAVNNILYSKESGKFYSIIDRYVPAHLNMKINDFAADKNDDDRLIVEGIEVYGLDLNNRNAVAKAYAEAVNEAEEFAKYLKFKLTVFSELKFDRAAAGFYMRELRHFKGEYVLGVNDILENRDFPDKIAVGSNPVDVSKFTGDKGRYIAGCPTVYSIPLGCIIPLKVDNLLMTGAKISCSSIASSSAGTISTCITTGEAAGIVAVYSLVKAMTPRDVLKKSTASMTRELQALLKRQGIYLPQIKTGNPNTTNWSYPAVRKLNSLGLLAGGVNNDYRFDSEGKEDDLAILLLNGVYRLLKNRYSLELDARMRRYFNSNALTGGKAAEILIAFHGTDAGGGNYFNTAAKLGYIDDAVKAKLKDDRPLTMDEVYYLSVRNIEMFTGRKIPE